MPPIVVPDAALGVVSGTYLGQPWANVIGLQLASPMLLSQSVVDDIATRIRSAYANLIASCSPQWNASSFVLQDLRTPTSASWNGAWSTLVGTATGDPLPSHLAMCVSHKTGFRGKSYNGRTYLCGFTEPANDTTGRIASGYTSLGVTLFTNIRANLALVSGGPVKQAVVSRTLSVATEVVSSTVDNSWDHMDRRKA